MWNKKITQNTFFIACVSFFMNFGNTIIFINAMNLWSQKDRAPQDFVLLKTVSASIGYYSKFFMGLLSDSGSRKKYLLMGYSTVLITKPLFLISSSNIFTIATSLTVFSICNMIDKVTNQLRDTPRDAMIIYSTGSDSSENLFFRKTISMLGSFCGGLFSMLFYEFISNSFVILFSIAFLSSIIGFCILLFKVEDVTVNTKEPAKTTMKEIFNLNYIILIAGFLFITLGQFNETHLTAKAIRLKGTFLTNQIIILLSYLGGFFGSLFLRPLNNSYLNTMVGKCSCF